MKKLIILLVLGGSLAAFKGFNQSFMVSSSAFQQGEFIPSKYSCQGDNVNPELKLSGLPMGTKSIALIMDDPDAPAGTFNHWIVWDIPMTEVINENSSPGTTGNNGRGEAKYTGPCPPSGTHHYHFKVFALDAMLSLPTGTEREKFENAMKGHIIGSTELIGLYRK
jgi:Raf kinase inhibitor-like YbhB/YbcL family protein